MLKSGKLGILSATLASACCGLPLLLIALGLGGLGFGAAVGKYHWYLTGGGILVLILAWGVFLREKRKLYALGSEIRGEKTTKGILAAATLAVLFFAGLNLYSALGGKEISNQDTQVTNFSSIVLPVEGMTCFACEASVEGALEGLPGVDSAKASAKSKNVLVEYQPGRVTFDQMVEAISRTGYKANLP